jgi:N-acetylmuramoyl-L-alanine amidase
MLMTNPSPSTPTLPSLEGGFVLPEDTYSQGDLDDITLLAHLVYAEARGEPFIGQIAVAAVLLNRLKHPGFPDTVRAAVYQPHQFEPVANGTIDQTPDNVAYLAVLEAWTGVDPTNGSVFFWNPSKVSAQSWVWTQSVKQQIGDHVFA